MPELTATPLDVLIDSLRAARRPALAVVGAGCSVSAGVPLAREIVDYVRYRHAGLLHDEQSDSYPAVMHRVPWQSRYSVFHGLVRLSTLNWAHVSLAALMRHRIVGRVLTTNFDDLVLRACTLFGLHPATHDLTVGMQAGSSGAGPAYRESLLREPAIVHLHGRHNGFAQMHSPAQLARQAEVLRAVIAETKRRCGPWIVIGYSGQSDPLLSALCAGGFPAGLFWLNRSPPEGDALRALRSAHGHFIAGDADTLLLTLARRLAKGGRDGLLLPALLQPAMTLAELPRPRVPVPALPTPTRVRQALNAALKQGEGSSVARAQESSTPTQIIALAEERIAAAEALLARARSHGGRQAVALFARAEATFAVAASLLPSRDHAFAEWDRLIFDSARAGRVSNDSETDRTDWRKALIEYRQSFAAAHLRAWAEGRAASVAALQPLSLEALKQRTDQVAARCKALPPSFALYIGHADLLLAQLARRTTVPGPGRGLLKRTFEILDSACALARQCPQGHPRVGTLRALRSPRGGPQHATSSALDNWRTRVHEASGL